MRILITGGAGFLGSALANYMLNVGHQVWVLDDLSAGDRDHLDAGVQLTRGDVRDIPKLWTLLRNMDCVYHLAARVLVPESVLYPVEYNAVNVGGTVSLMTAARDARVRRVVLASSATVYGEQTHQPIPETATPQPPNPYAVSKLASEYYTRAIGAEAGIETVILRIFNAYGLRQPLPPSHAPVVPQLLKQALGGGSMVISGDGQQTRDFVYVDDVVDALAASAEGQDVDGMIINIGSGVETSINELARLIAQTAGHETRPLYNPSAEGGISRSVADISLARRTLGFVPHVTLAEGLRRMVRAMGSRQRA